MIQYIDIKSAITHHIGGYMDTVNILELALVVSTAALSISEYLGSTERFKSNNIIQAIGNGSRLLISILSGATAVKKDRTKKK